MTIVSEPRHDWMTTVSKLGQYLVETPLNCGTRREAKQMTVRQEWITAEKCPRYTPTLMI